MTQDELKSRIDEESFDQSSIEGDAKYLPQTYLNPPYQVLHSSDEKLRSFNLTIITQLIIQIYILIGILFMLSPAGTSELSNEEHLILVLCFAILTLFVTIMILYTLFISIEYWRKYQDIGYQVSIFSAFIGLIIGFFAYFLLSRIIFSH
ncbi:MAG: hypothetical protein JSW00_00915 [Thermoplasmata archaeon]|nr:MAG: hypothetical protein JSW00_00915 [Thermoplasmata archaeon]